MQNTINTQETLIYGNLKLGTNSLLKRCRLRASVDFLCTCKTMVAFKRSCNIVDLKYVLVRLIAENEHTLIVLVAGITSTNLTSVTT